jgi:hypothetical protein
MSRIEVLNELAGKLERLRLGRPVRVAIDGRTASGKTTLADELAGLIAERGRSVIGVTRRFVQNCTLRRGTSDHPFSVSVSHAVCL